MSNVNPSALRSSPARLASALPCSERSTSVQPVKRFSLFQMLSPWRSSTIFVMGSPAREHKMALVASSYCLSHLGIGQRHWVDCLHEPNVSLVSTARLLGIPVDVRDHLRF